MSDEIHIEFETVYVGRSKYELSKEFIENHPIEYDKEVINMGVHIPDEAMAVIVEELGKSLNNE